jgi:hypothetical protein
MGAVTISNVRTLGNVNHVRGRAVTCRITMPASYDSGGSALSHAGLGLTSIDHMFIIASPATSVVKGKNVVAATGGAFPRLAGTRTARLIQAFAAADGTNTQVSGAVDLTDVVFDAIFIGQ